MRSLSFLARCAAIVIAVAIPLLTACHSVEGRGQPTAARPEHTDKGQAPPSSPTSEKPAAGPQNAVIVHLKLAGGKFGTASEVVDCQELEDQLEKEIARAGVGEMDGNEIGEDECTLFMYGPDADRLFSAIERSLRASPLAKGAWAIKRYGAAEDPQARQVRVDL